MQKRPPGYSKTASGSNGTFPTESSSLPREEVLRCIQEFLLDCEYRQYSPRTLEEERAVLEKFHRHLVETKADACSAAEIRHYLTRVGLGEMQRGGWLVAEGYLDTSPLDRIKPPIVRPDQITPFTEQQISNLVSASRRSTKPRRDEAIVTFLLDTGVRASELCGIRMRDLDTGNHHCRVRGKGNKYRVVHFGRGKKRCGATCKCLAAPTTSRCSHRVAVACIGPENVRASQGEFSIISMDGQLFLTNGKVVQDVSCDSVLTTIESDVVMRCPVRWKTIPAGAKVFVDK